jgi:hypothetical protein
MSRRMSTPALSRARLTLVLACAVLSAAGCATVGVTRMKQAAAKPEGCQLEVFGAESEVKRPFDVVCLLDSKTGTTLFDDRSAAAAIEKAKPEACRCGGDGIIVGEAGASGADLGGWGQGKATLRVIRFTEGATPSR